MTHQVKNMKQVDYLRMSKDEREHYGFEGLYREWACTAFDEDDSYDLYVNMDDMCDDYNQRKYAVYQRSTGELKCLLGDAAMALDLCYDDIDFRDKRHELYKQIALAAGWPENLPIKKRFTVHIVRAFDVEVHADNRGQAREIGRAIERSANGTKSYAVSPILDQFDNEIRLAVRDTYYELVDAWDAEDEDSGVWDLSLSEKECEQILHKED